MWVFFFVCLLVLPIYSIEEATKYKVYSSSSFLKLSPLILHSQLLLVYINTQVLVILKNKTINKYPFLKPVLSKSSVRAPSFLIILKEKATISSLSLPIEPPVLWPCSPPPGLLSVAMFSGQFKSSYY